MTLKIVSDFRNLSHREGRVTELNIPQVNKVICDVDYVFESPKSHPNPNPYPSSSPHQFPS